MQHIQLVVFDLAGTTIDDSGGAVLRCLVEAAGSLDLPDDPVELNSMMGMNKLEVFTILAERAIPDTGRREKIAGEALERFYEKMVTFYDMHLQPIPGAEDTFRFLRARHIKIAIDTGFDRRITGPVIERLGWMGHMVDTVVSSSEVARGRPAPYMIFRAMETLDIIDVRRVMKIGDSPADLEEGANAGCAEVIGVLSGAHQQDTLSVHPYARIIESVADLPALFA